MMNKDEIFLNMNTEELLKFGRYAGGHDDHMKGLVKDSKVIGHWNEGDYQGQVATCLLLNDGTYMVYTDYYGSCSGCDAWEDASDESILKMCQDLIYTSHLFNSLEEVKEYLLEMSRKESKYNSDNEFRGLLEEIEKQLGVFK
jgi:hypothetical protein